MRTSPAFLRVIQPPWCITHLWQKEHSWDCTQTSLSITLIWIMCRFVKIRFMHPDVAVSLADPSCYLFSAVLTLNPLHHWPYMLYFATEASHVDYKDDLHWCFPFPLVISAEDVQTLYSFIQQFIWRCGNASVFTQDSASQDNLWPIRLIFRRLHFLVCSDKVPVERANSVAVGNATCCLSSHGGHSCCYWCCYIMIARESLVVILLSPDESGENNSCHVSRVLSSPSISVDLFCFDLSRSMQSLVLAEQKCLRE